MDNSLHVVSFDVPFPPDYGGAVDVYYKLRELHRAGYQIILHCYEYGRGRQNHLNEFCKEVYYYSRKLNFTGFLKGLPYIVSSRNQCILLDRLKADSFPILFEGLHCCFFLNHPDLRNRKRVVRTHNVEHHYYMALASAEKSFFRKLYYLWESKRLRSYEQELAGASALASISKPDANHFRAINPITQNISAFHPFVHVQISDEMSDFALYHGNLAVPENNRAALYLVNEVMNDLDFRFIIAGNNPSDDLRAAVSRYDNITLLDSLSTLEIHSLISGAQVNLLPTFQATGIKLKLLAALFTGKHCIVNTPMVENTGLESLCQIAENTQQFKQLLSVAMGQRFSMAEVIRRKQILEVEFSNLVQVGKLMELLK